MIVSSAEARSGSCLGALSTIILIVRKLHSGKYWGGNHNKGFLKSDDIANGRGVSPDFKDITTAVANFLRIRGILVAKKGTGRRRGRRKEQKYALNTERRSDIESLVDIEYDEGIRALLKRVWVG